MYMGYYFTTGRQVEFHGQRQPWTTVVRQPIHWCCIKFTQRWNSAIALKQTQCLCMVGYSYFYNIAIPYSRLFLAGHKFDGYGPTKCTLNFGGYNTDKLISLHSKSTVNSFLTA